MNNQNYKLLRTLEFKEIIPLSLSGMALSDFTTRTVDVYVVYAPKYRLFGFEFYGKSVYFHGNITKAMDCYLPKIVEVDAPLYRKMGIPHPTYTLSPCVKNGLPEYIYVYMLTNFDDGFIVHPKKIIYTLNKEGIEQ